jgi:hypothetical protein
MNALDAHDYARAIADLRTGLQKNEGLQTVLPPSVEDLLRANLALAQGALGNLHKGRLEICRMQKRPRGPCA